MVLLLAMACTGTRTREFTRESYLAPEPAPPRARVFGGSSEPVRAALADVLAARGASLAEDGPEPDVLRAALPWQSAFEAAASVELGRVRRVVTRTERSYRSTSPLDWRCNECVVRNGRITGQRTELLGEVTLALDPALYRIEATLWARVEAVRSGTRVELALELDADPPDPQGLAPASTGRLEDGILTAIERLLTSGEPRESAQGAASGPSGLR
jgi:hypothetical protein